MPKLVQKVIGLDFNALYLHSIMQDMPVGTPEWWKLENDRLVRKSETMEAKLKARHSHGEVEYLQFRSWRDNIPIYTAADGIQKRLGQCQFRADGYTYHPVPTVINYNGCYYHGHQNGCLRPQRNIHPNIQWQRQQDVKQETGLKAAGIRVITVWECEWMMIKEAAKRLGNRQPCDPRFKDEAIKYQEYLRQHPPREFRTRQQVTPKEMFDAIVNGSVFGFAKVDIYTPDHLKELYEDFPPLIKHADVSRQDLGPYMERLAEEYDRLKKPQDALIGSYFGEGIWLMTPMLQFYRAHGLEIRSIIEVVQYDKRKTFQWFGETVTEHRQQGDADKDKAIIAEVYKLLGNSAYGKCITNLKLHMDTSFGDQEELERLHNDPRHKRSMVIDEDTYEIHNQKEEIKFELPMVIGLAVYNYSKLRMLSFIYDILLVFFLKQDYLFLESDTDSVYLGLSAGTLEEVVREDKRKEWEAVRGQWFVMEASQKRTPGLLKVEKEADHFIGLCSKTYICATGEDVSVRAKCVQPRNVHIFSFENFRKILFCEPGAQRIAFNMGIRAMGSDVVTYVQEKNGLTPVYTKRISCQDGYTLPLKI